MDELEEIHLPVARREVDAAIVVDAAGLAGDRLELAIEVEGVFLQLRDVGVRVERRDAARGVPGRARGQLVLLDQDDIGPADLGEMVQTEQPTTPPPITTTRAELFMVEGFLQAGRSAGPEVPNRS